MGLAEPKHDPLSLDVVVHSLVFMLGHFTSVSLFFRLILFVLLLLFFVRE